MILGIDPGLTGALALIDGDECLKIWDMPTSPKTHGKGQQVNAYILADILDAAIEMDAGAEYLTAHLERVASMPKQGVAGVFGFGRSVGVVEGVLASEGVRVRFVLPNAWKGACGLLKKPKEAAITVACERFPEIADKLTRKKDVGRADAILIGAYGAAE